ncbi:MAG: ABC transporter permease [Coriobacteriia bacterium]|nr:ABC transporter permease [Coriobacteriia bacterium]
MKALAIARISVTRVIRDRSNIFFVFMLPMMLILVLGATFGGGFEPRVGVQGGEGGPLARELAEGVSDLGAMEVSRWEDRDALVLAVERGRVEVAVLIPEDYDEVLASGREAAVEYVSRPDASAQALRSTIESVVVEQAAILRAAAFAAARAGAGHEEALTTAREQAGEVARIDVGTEAVGELSPFERVGRFELGAYSQLLLFVFLTSMTASTALIESRRLGVSGRMLATPTSTRTIVFGEGLGRLAVALLQGLFIILGTALVFGVDWGDPFGAVAVLLVFSLGASGTAMLMGSVLRNEEQAGGIGVVLGIGLGALGGSMVPLMVMEVFSPTLYRVAHFTPHAWGIRAFETLILEGGSIADILPELGVLAGFAAVMYALGAWRLRVALTRG